MIKNIEIVYDNKESILKSSDDLAKHLSRDL